MANSLDLYLIDTKKYVSKWVSPTTSVSDVSFSDYSRTFTLEDGTKITANRNAYATGFSTMSYIYRLQSMYSTLPTTWDKTKAKLYMRSTDDKTYQEYDVSELLGFTSAKRVNVNLARDVWHTYPESDSGIVTVIIDIDSGLPSETYKVTSNLTNITFENQVATIKANSEFSFVFSANDGYEIDTLTCNIGTVSISTDKQSASITGTATTNITITGTGKALPKQYTVDFSLIDITCDNPQTTITENETFNFTFTPNIGYEINTLNSNIGTVTIADDKQTASITGTATENITITGIGSQIQTVYTIAYTLNNMTCVDPIYTIVEGTEFNLYFTANTGYLIDSLTSNLGAVEIASDKKSATITGTATDNIGIIGNARKENHYVKITGTLNNCYCSYENEEVIISTKPCEIIANIGYVFPSKLMYKYYAYINNEYVTKYASISSDGYRLTFDFIFNNEEVTIVLDNTYTAEKEQDKISDFVDVYCVNNTIIKQIAENRYLKLTSSTGDVSYTDLGQFIVGLYVLPLGIPETLITSTKIVKMGYVETDVTAPIINGYKWTYDLGTINIPTVYNNSYDYINTDVFLNVPYFGRLEIPSYLVGYNLSINIIFDCYSGNGTLLIKNDFTNSYIETKTQKIVIDVPYIQTGLNTVFNKLSNTNIDPLINRCFVEVIRNTPYTHECTFGHDVDDVVLIGSVQGYAEFKECLISSSVATSDELTSIIQLLNNGVVIA
jgi:hypothetical protein